MLPLAHLNEINLEDYIVESSIALTSAVERMSKNRYKGLIVLENQKVYGVFTRHDLVACCHMFELKDVSIRPFVNTDYVSCSEKCLNQAFKSLHSIIPVVDSENRLKNVIFPERKIEKKYDIPVAVMAGGLGTRLYPYTKDIPKPLVPVVDNKPMIELVMDTFRTYSSTHFNLIVNHKKEMIIEYFQHQPEKDKICCFEENIPLGTGGGLKLLEHHISGTFFLTNCDILVLENYNEIYEYHRSAGNLITMIAAIKPIKVPYGVISVDEQQRLIETTEKPTYMILVNTGVYVVDSKVFDYIEIDERVDFPTIIDRVKRNGQKVGIYPITEDKWLDMGQIEELNHTRKYLEERWNHQK